MAKTKIFRTFTDNLPTILGKNVFHEIRPKSFSQGFLLIFKFFQKLSENSGRIFRKIIAQEFHEKYFSEFYNFPKFSENFETILVDVRFQFIWQLNPSGKMALSYPMISQSNCEKAGQDDNNGKYKINWE